MITIYDLCAVCGKEDDLNEWRKVAYVCKGCFARLDMFNISKTPGKYRLDKYTALRILREEMRTHDEN